MGRDKRTPEEKAAWEAGKFTEAEAAAAGTTAAELNAAREEGERDAGNPSAPPR